MSKIHENPSSAQSARKVRRPSRVDKASNIPSSVANIAQLLDEANQPSVADVRMVKYLEMVTDPMRAIEEGNLVGAPSSVDFSAFSTKFTTRAYSTFTPSGGTSLIECYGSVVAPTLSRGLLDVAPGGLGTQVVQSDFPAKTPFFGTPRQQPAPPTLSDTVNPLIATFRSAVPPALGVETGAFGTIIPTPSTQMSAGKVPVSLRGSRIRLLARHYEVSFSGNAFNSSGTAYLVTPKNLLSAAPTTGPYSNQGGSLYSVTLAEALADPGNQVVAIPLSAMCNEGEVLSFTRIPTSDYEIRYAQGDYSNLAEDVQGYTGPNPDLVGFIEAVFFFNGLLPTPGAGGLYPSINVCITSVFEMVSNGVGIGSSNLPGDALKYLNSIPPSIRPTVYNNPDEISQTRAMHVADAVATHHNLPQSKSLLAKAGDFIVDNVLPMVAKLGGAAASTALGAGPVPGAMLGSGAAQIIDTFHRHPALPAPDRPIYRFTMPEPVSTPRIEEPDLNIEHDDKQRLRMLPVLGASPTATAVPTHRPVLRILVDQPDGDGHTVATRRSE
jgi:hypothetical protein